MTTLYEFLSIFAGIWFVAAGLGVGVVLGIFMNEDWGHDDWMRRGFYIVLIATFIPACFIAAWHLFTG